MHERQVGGVSGVGFSGHEWSHLTWGVAHPASAVTLFLLWKVPQCGQGAMPVAAMVVTGARC